MMYTLDLSGHADDGKAGIDRFGGRFLTVEDAEAHGRLAAPNRRLVFRPTTLWVRDEEGNVVRQVAIREPLT